MDDEYCPKHETWFGRKPCPGCDAERQTRKARNLKQRTRRLDNKTGFASLRELVYTKCPCGCGFRGVCDAQLARARAHDAALEF